MLAGKANRWLLICLKLDCIFSGLIFLLEEQVRREVCVCVWNVEDAINVIYLRVLSERVK